MCSFAGSTAGGTHFGLLCGARIEDLHHCTADAGARVKSSVVTSLEEKVKKIQAGAARLGLSCVDARLQDASVYDPQLGEFDRVLCDAPCSGIGIIGRKPEIKYKEEAQLSDLPQLQLKILENVCRYVKVGGRLVYSTCTLLPNENTKVVEQFLQRHSEFEPLILPQRVLQAANSTPTWALTLLPQMAQTDGFFIAGMKRVR